MAFKDKELEQLSQQIINQAMQRQAPQLGSVLQANQMQKSIDRRLVKLRK